jgi:Cys-tRNA(Pro)/Cys-tRNA(Cys) deacylase
MIHKTNAIRILDAHKINYELKEYEVDEDDLSAVHVAKLIGIHPDKIYKTLVMKGQKDPYLVAVIPGNAQLNLKKIAKVSGNKNCEMLPVKDLLAVTGYIRGGCSPIGMKKQFPVFIEETATLEEKIIISAGKRGLQIIINPNELALVTGAQFADIG